jgi:hypothetical protein
VQQQLHPLSAVAPSCTLSIWQPQRWPSHYTKYLQLCNKQHDEPVVSHETSADVYRPVATGQGVLPLCALHNISRLELTAALQWKRNDSGFVSPLRLPQV